MKTSAFHILRVGMAITFLWIGILIFSQPEAWGGLILPWASNFLPIPIKEIMIGTALFDIFIGVFLLIDVLVYLAALFGAFHLIIVLIVSGINAITVRDIGLLTALIALIATALPDKFNFLNKKTSDNLAK